MDSEEIAALLAQTDLLAGFTRAEIEPLVACARIEQHGVGATLFKQRERAEHVFVVISGRLEESLEHSGTSVLLGTAGVGEVLGEECVRCDAFIYQSSAVVIEHLSFIRLPVAPLAELLKQREHFESTPWTADLLDRLLLVKRVTAFEQLAPDALSRLSAALVERQLQPGEVLVTAGSVPEACWIVSEGQLEACLGEKRLSLLEPGAIISEVSAIAGGPVRADVVATRASRLYELKRDDLLLAVRGSSKLRASLGPRARLRLRPVQSPNIEAHEVGLVDGEKRTVLKDPKRLVYFRLSAVGAYIWPRLDGRHTPKDLVIGYLGYAKQFAVEPIAFAIQGLIAGGFAQAGADLSFLADPIAARRRFWRRYAASVIGGMNWHVSIGRGDRLAGVLHAVLRPLTTRTGLHLCVLIAIFGVVSTLLAVAQRTPSVAASLSLHPMWILAMVVGTIILHEAAHATATKAIGRSVNGIGVGWHWAVPFAYVDTSDAWLSTPRERLAVTMAGPLANGLVAGVCMTLAILMPPGHALFAFALVNVIILFFNLNPLTQFDGYIAMLDASGEPRLREEALAAAGAWTRQVLARSRPAALRPIHRQYILASALYVTLMSAFVVALVAGFALP